MSHYELFFDGSNKPTHIGYGWVLLENDVVIEEGSGRGSFSKNSNNVAEYCALGFGLARFVKSNRNLSDCTLQIYGDSMLVVNQINREWACKTPHLRPLRDNCWDFWKKLNCSHKAISWIPREQNKLADALSRNTKKIVLWTDV